MKEYLTTRELAELLRIKERKVYELAASGEVPCSRALGKLLFPRRAVDSWLAGGDPTLARSTVPSPPSVLLGSHDPLLEWAMAESRSGLASFLDGSLDGLERFARREGIAAGLHLFDPDSGEWNVPFVRTRFGGQPVVLAEWAWRRRGFVVADRDRERIGRVADLRGRRVVPRQSEAGCQALLQQLLKDADVAAEEIEFTPPARTESEAVLAVFEGKAEVAFGLETLAARYRLGFVPVVDERFDLLVDRRAWFEPPFQTLLDFCRSGAFRVRLEEVEGYAAADLGRVHFNGS
ncbi:MAG: substrate-binding domain-containing protein [Rhodospirillales bacterium]